MSELIFQGILEDPKFKTYFEKVKPSDQQIFKKFNIKVHCAKAVNKLFKDKDFVAQLQGKEKEEQKEGDETEQSVSNFQLAYRKILFEAQKQCSLIKEDEDRKFLIVKNGNEVTIYDKDHNEIKDPKILLQVTNYIKNNKDEIKSKSKGDEDSKALDSVLSAEALQEGNSVFSETLASFNTGINEDAIDDEVYKKLVNSLKFDFYKKKALKAGYNKETLKSFSDDIAKLFAAVFAVKFIQVNGGTTEEKQNAKNQEEKKMQLIHS